MTDRPDSIIDRDREFFAVLDDAADLVRHIRDHQRWHAARAATEPSTGDYDAALVDDPGEALSKVMP
jgi:hypothetical protein